jgi:hypothetical protein
MSVSYVTINNTADITKQKNIYEKLNYEQGGGGRRVQKHNAIGSLAADKA